MIARRKSCGGGEFSTIRVYEAEKSMAKYAFLVVGRVLERKVVERLPRSFPLNY